LSPITLRVYRLLEKLGEGGMGALYRALHGELDKVVALKVLAGSRVGDERAVARFRREMKAVGRLEHPHIVRALDAGVEGGTHYLVMEYVAGLDVGKVVDRLGPLPVADACEIVRQAALGLQHAHEHGLVHRDVKPSNLILTQGHGSPSGGLVKVLDLGLARLAERTAEVSSELTGEGQLMGTLEYMAPEQGQNTRAADARADVYSLGATLYKLLSGHAPFSGNRYAGALQKAMALALDEPPPVQERRAASLAERGTPASAGLPEALAALVHRLLEKDPDRRLSTAAEVASALEPFGRGSDLAALLGRATATPAARPAAPAVSTADPRSVGSSLPEPQPQTPAAAPSTSAPQPAPRRRRPAALVAVGLLVLIGGIVLAQVVIRIRDKQGKVVSEVTIAEGKMAEILRDGKVVGTVPGEKEPTGAKPPPAAVPIQPEPLPPLQGDEPLSPLALVQRLASLPGVRSWSLETAGHRGRVAAVACSPDGHQVASAGEDGTIRVWGMADGQLHRVLIGHADRLGKGGQTRVARMLAWSPDGKSLASGGGDTTVRLWDVATGRLLRTLTGHRHRVLMVLWSPDGKQVLSWDGAKVVRLWDAASGQLLREPKWQGGMILDAAWSPDGKTVACASWDPFGLQLWDVGTAQLLGTFDNGKEVGQCLAWSHGGDLLAVTDETGVTHLLEGRSGKVQRQLPASGWLLWQPGDEELLVIGSRGEISRAQLKTGKVTPVAGSVHGNWQIGRPDCSPDGKTLVAGDGGGAVLFREVHKGDVLQTLAGCPDAPSIGWVRWSPEGRRILRSCRNDPMQSHLWDLGAKRSLTARHFPGAPLAWSPDGRKVALVAGKEVRVVEPSTGKELQVLHGHTFDPNLAEWSPDGRLLASSSRDETVRVWDPESGKNLHTWSGYRVGGGILISWSPDGKRLATAGDWGTTTRIHEVATGKVVATIPAPPGYNVRLGTWGGKPVWSPDGKKLALGTEKLRLWEVASGQLEDTYETPEGVVPLAWLADGSLVAVTDPDRTLRVWNSSGRLARTVKLPAVGILSPDRRLLASQGACVTWVWEVETGRPRGTLLQLRNERSLTIAADGHYSGSPRVERELVCVVENGQGREVLTPEEFAGKYGWQNDPQRVRLTEATLKASRAPRGRTENESGIRREPRRRTGVDRLSG
jgi:WD40 repeat protein/serine/threonine protein kinase